MYMALDQQSTGYARGRFEADCATKRTRILAHGRLNANADGFDDSAEARPRWANPARKADEVRLTNLVCAPAKDRDRYAASIHGDWRKALDGARSRAHMA